jgi:hypothetical protein
MCELTHGMAGERHGNGMGATWARHAMCESTCNAIQAHEGLDSSCSVRGTSTGEMLFLKLNERLLWKWCGKN